MAAYDGLAYNGTFVSNEDAQKSPSNNIEIPFSDANFIERAGDKKPNAVIRFFEGAAGYPRDAHQGTIFLMMLSGVLGSEMKNKADTIARRMRTLILEIKSDPSFYGSVFGVYTKHKIEDADFWGRFLGGFVTGLFSKGSF